LASAARTASLLAPKVYESKIISTYKILLHLDCFVSRDKVNRAAGRRLGALFFARHQDYFIVTRNFTAVYRDLVLFNSYIVTRNYSSVYLDWQKTWHRDADGT
jgi:hypothetical protein